MKSKFFTVLCLFFMLKSEACEICGCSSGTLFIGPYVHFKNHFVGVRYTFRSFDTRLKSDPTQFSTDFYQTAELYSGWNINKKLQLLVFVPYNVNIQHSDDGIKNNNGLGDISAILNYSLLNYSRMNGQGRMLKQQLFIGGGFKIPTGKFNADPSSLVPSANNQVGTGTLDFILSSTYSLIYDKIGVSSNVTYKINQSAKEFHFGNRLSANLFTTYSIPTKHFTLSPYAGLLFEKLNSNEVSKVKVAQTGGRALDGSVGIDVNFKKIAVGMNIQAPLSENISDNQTHTKLIGMAHITFVI